MTAPLMNQRTVKVTLHQGDDLDRLAELNAAANQAKANGPTTLTESGDYTAAALAHDSFRAEADERAVTVEMKPLPRKEYQALLVQHPPRDDDPGDAVIGANAETFAEALLMKSITSPAMSDTERQAFLDSLTAGQFATLADEVLVVNRVVFAPKAPLLGSAPSQS